MKAYNLKCNACTRSSTNERLWFAFLQPFTFCLVGSTISIGNVCDEISKNWKELAKKSASVSEFSNFLVPRRDSDYFSSTWLMIARLLRSAIAKLTRLSSVAYNCKVEKLKMLIEFVDLQEWQKIFRLQSLRVIDTWKAHFFHPHLNQYQHKHRDRIIGNVMVCLIK